MSLSSSELGAGPLDGVERMSEEGTTTGILIVDEHDVVRRGLLALLTAAFPTLEFGIAGTRTELAAELVRRHWALVILDVGIANANGFDAIADIKAKTKSKVLAFSSFAGDDLGVRAIQVGADGFLRRDVKVEELVVAIRRLLEGHRYVSPELAERIADMLAKPKGSGLSALSNRELYVLRRIGEGRTTGEIAKEMNLSVKTISTYRSRVLEKLHLHTTAELVRYALENHISG